MALAELQKRADRADQSVLFFLAGANFMGKAREKLCYFVYFCVFFVYFLVLFFGGGNWSVLIFTPFATMC